MLLKKILDAETERKNKAVKGLRVAGRVYSYHSLKDDSLFDVTNDLC